jgi:DNA-binding IclR family transcriptional regulator
MRVPRTTVIRRLDRLQRWGLIDRRGRHYYMHEKKLNSLIGMKLTIMALREALHTAAPGACKAFVQKITLDQ